MGGPSSEREISLKSGQAVLNALLESGIDALGIDIVTDNFSQNITKLASYNLDGVFIALHGRFGEDGSIQEILERMSLPYTGSGVEASRLAMNKIGALKIFKEGGLNVPKARFIEKSGYLKKREFKNDLGLPLVVKPSNHGSSIGLSLVEDEKDILKAIDLAFEYDGNVVVEEFIRGRELTVGMLGEDALPVIEIVPKRKFFDFEAKYKYGLTDYIVPAVLGENISRKVQQTAIAAHRLLGCFGCSRTDVILNDQGLPYILEVNTIPGMTSTSLLPKAAKVIGIDFKQLCIRLLELSYEKTKV